MSHEQPWGAWAVSAQQTSAAAVTCRCPCMLFGHDSQTTPSKTLHLFSPKTDVVWKSIICFSHFMPACTPYIETNIITISVSKYTQTFCQCIRRGEGNGSCAISLPSGNTWEILHRLSCLHQHFEIWSLFMPSWILSRWQNFPAVTN